MLDIAKVTALLNKLAEDLPWDPEVPITGPQMAKWNIGPNEGDLLSSVSPMLKEIARLREFEAREALVVSPDVPIATAETSRFYDEELIATKLLRWNLSTNRLGDHPAGTRSYAHWSGDTHWVSDRAQSDTPSDYWPSLGQEFAGKRRREMIDSIETCLFDRKRFGIELYAIALTEEFSKTNPKDLGVSLNSQKVSLAACLKASPESRIKAVVRVLLWEVGL